MIKRMMMALCIFVCTFTLVACSGQQTNEPLTLGVNAIKTEIDKENKIITTKDSEEKGVLGNDRSEQFIKMIFAEHIADFHFSRGENRT